MKASPKTKKKPESIRFNKLPQPFRFLIVGGVNTLIGYLVFALLVVLGETVLTVVIMPYVSHLLVSPLTFFLYRTLVFHSTRGIVSSFLRFQAGYALPLLLNGPLLYLGIAVLNGDPLVVQAALTVLLVATAFVATRYFAFSSPRQSAQSPNQHLTKNTTQSKPHARTGLSKPGKTG